MAKEPALNMKYFNENIKGLKDINTEYKKTIEKEDNIKTGESYLNYLFSNDYMKPFIRKNYEFKEYKKAYFEKLNIFNYKDIFNDILNKKKNTFATSENEPIKKMLNILDINYEKNNNRFKIKNKNLNTKYTNYFKNIDQNNSITHYNNKLHTSFEPYILPKINIKKENIVNHKTERNREQNQLDNENDIFRNTSCDKTNGDNKKINSERKERYNKKLHYYSPLLKKNIKHIFNGVEYHENESVKKSRYIQDGIEKINKTKFNIDSYDFVKNRYNIKLKKNVERKYCLINLFTDIGKIKSPQEIEKTLFNKDENITFCKLKTKLEKRGIKRINRNLGSIRDS